MTYDKGWPFYLTEVTMDAHHMLQSLEHNTLAADYASDAEAVEAYTLLCHTRKEIYEYISELERLAEMNPDLPRTHLRFI